MTWEISAVLPGLGRIVAFAFLFIVVLTAASLSKDWLTPRHRLNDALVHADNAAVGIILAGYYLAVAAVFSGASLGPSQGFVADMASIAGYSALGVLLLNASRFVLERVVFVGSDAMDLIVNHRNVAVGSACFGGYVATGLVAAAAVYGEGGGWISSIVFFVLGQSAFMLFAWLYERVTPYDVRAEVVAGNLAAGIAFAGNLIGLGLVLARAVGGTFVNWQASLMSFAIDLAIGVTLLIGFRFVLERLLVRGGILNAEISRDRNIAAGLVEASAAVGLGGAIAAVL